HNLPATVCDAIRPAYDDLCSENSLAQVLDGGTTNPNESFHRIIWSLCSKKRYHIRKHVQLAVDLTVIIYNDCYIGLTPVLEKLGIQCKNIPAFTKMITLVDKERIIEDQQYEPERRHEKRTRARTSRLLIESTLRSKDPNKYGPGIG
ncbi:unnamed protein product, partial [Didymodactylos carnosus]